MLDSKVPQQGCRRPSEHVLRYAPTRAMVQARSGRPDSGSDKDNVVLNGRELYVSCCKHIVSLAKPDHVCSGNIP